MMCYPEGVPLNLMPSEEDDDDEDSQDSKNITGIMKVMMR